MENSWSPYAFVAKQDYHSTASGGVPVRVFATSQSASQSIAREVAILIRNRAAAGRTCVLGLATGSTPTGVYDELVRLHREEKLSFATVITFNLDEYWPMAPDALQSYRRFMAEHLFDHIDIDPTNIHIPDGTLAADKVSEFCSAYEERIRSVGGIDLQILGVGRTGHIGFNEPGSPRESRTRLITLDKVTRMDAASDFFGEWNVPRQAITMGVGTILAAKRIIMMAWGESKATVLRRAFEEQVGSAVAASFLQEHANVEVVLDRAAAGELTPVKAPWLLGPLARSGLAWNLELTRRAVIWLALRVKKPILKLVAEDYNENGLQELISTRGSAYAINIAVFRKMQSTITGWPGGKRNAAVAAKGPANADKSEVADHFLHASAAFPKRVVVFSPHPDDDVISMGGTFIRLCEQGHDVHVAYQTSGNIAVFDDEALRYADFVAELAAAFDGLGKSEAARIREQIQEFVAAKSAGMVDSAELQQIKGIIRRTEARAAARYSGVRSENIHFLDMPFYETGRVRKKPLSPADVAIITELLERIRPHQIYAAGDLSDPHGTHRVCLAGIVASVKDLRDRDWMRECEFWLYRGAWQEWGPAEIEMAVPLSPDEVERKRLAIFKHQSQKDRALFPGPSDAREFWQRAEQRNQATAEIFDKLGLPEYQAIEAFVRWREDQ